MHWMFPLSCPKALFSVFDTSVHHDLLFGYAATQKLYLIFRSALPVDFFTFETNFLGGDAYSKKPQ